MKRAFTHAYPRKARRYPAFSWLLAFTVFLIPAAWPSFPRAALPPQASEGTGLRLAAARSCVEGPVDWVAAGGSLLIYGSGSSMTVAAEDSPAVPLSRMALEGRVSEGVLFGRYAYLAEESQGLRVIDLLDPGMPRDLGLIPLQRAPIHLAQMGDDLLVASSGSGLKILDAAGAHACHAQGGDQPAPEFDPLNPREVGFLPVPGAISSIAADGTRVYISEAAHGTVLVDLSDPARPFEAGLLHPDAGASAMAVSGGVLLESRGRRGLLARDLVHPNARAALPVQTSALAYAGRIVYAATGRGGILVLEAGPAAESTFNVNVGNTYFQPSTLHVFPGDTVQWTWVGGTHSTTSGTCTGGGYGGCSPDGKWDSGTRSSGTFTHAFASTGSNPYYCTVHQSSMTGKVAVDTPATLSAEASASVTSGPAPLIVSFTGSASGGTSPYTFSWAFGDGSSSTQQNPSHTYGTAGTYSAVLTVNDGSGANAQAAAITITVTSGTPVFTASAAASATSGVPPLHISFTAAASGGVLPYSYLWNFGDGTDSAVQDPNHTYVLDGTYHVTLTVTDAAGTQATDSHVVITVSSAAPPLLSTLKKLGGPFRIKVMGANFETGIQVFINGFAWSDLKLKNDKLLVITGGAALKAAVPKGQATQLTFVNPDGGQASTVFFW